MSKPNETTKDFSKVAETMVANAINSEIDFLLSDLNITPKTKIRILVKLEDLRHQTFVRGIKNTSIMIEDDKQQEDFIYNSIQKYNKALRDNDLLDEKTSSTSMERHSLNCKFEEWKLAMEKEGLLFRNPTNAKQLVYSELSKGIRGKGVSDEDWNKKPSKVAYIGLTLQCPFVEFEDKVKMVEKIVKS